MKLSTAILRLIGYPTHVVVKEEPVVVEPKTCPQCGAKYRHSASYCSQECNANTSTVCPLIGRRGKGTRKQRRRS